MVYRWTRADGTTGTAIRTTDVDNEGATIVVELRNDLLTVELWNDFTAEPLCMQVKYWCDLVAIQTIVREALAKIRAESQKDKPLLDRFGALPEWAQQWVCGCDTGNATPSPEYFYQPYTCGNYLELWRSAGWCELVARVERWPDQVTAFDALTLPRIDQAEAMAKHWAKFNGSTHEEVTLSKTALDRLEPTEEATQ